MNGTITLKIRRVRRGAQDTEGIPLGYKLGGRERNPPPQSNRPTPPFLPWVFHDHVRGPFSCLIRGLFWGPQPMFQPLY